MTLSPDMERLVDEAILRKLMAFDSEFGLSADAISICLTQSGLTIGCAAVASRLLYLADPAIQFVAPVPMVGAYHAEEQFWRITAPGRNHVNRQRRALAADA